MDPKLSCEERQSKSHHMKHTQETKHRAMLLDSWNEFLSEAKSTVTRDKIVRGSTVLQDKVSQTITNFRVHWEDQEHKTKGSRLTGVRT